MWLINKNKNIRLEKLNFSILRRKTDRRHDRQGTVERVKPVAWWPYWKTRERDSKLSFKDSVFYLDDEVVSSFFESSPDVFHALAVDVKAIVLLLHGIFIRIYPIFLDDHEPRLPVS